MDLISFGLGAKKKRKKEGERERKREKEGERGRARERVTDYGLELYEIDAFNS